MAAFTKSGFYFAWVCFSLPNIILAIAFGVTYRRLTALNRLVGGIFCDSKLMCLHYVTFLIGASLDFFLLALETCYLRRAEFGDNPDDMQEKKG